MTEPVSRARHAAVVALILVAVGFVYAPVIHQGFIRFDDPEYVYANPHVLGGLTREGVKWAFTSVHIANYHPLTSISLMLDVQLFGARAGPIKVVNVLLHAINSVLLYAVVGRLALRWRVAVLVSLLFAVHPTRVESVAWVSERKDVLCGLFFMLTLAAYAWHAQKPSAFRLLTTTGLLSLGLLCKPMLVTVPAVVMLLDIWPLGRTRRRRVNVNDVGAATREESIDEVRFTSVKLRLVVLEKLVLLLPVVMSCVVTVIVQRTGGAVGGWTDYPLSIRVANAFVSVTRYVGLLAWPVGLSPFYPYPEHWSAGAVAGSVLAFALIFLVALKLRRACPVLLIGWLWFVVMLLPVIGLMQVGRQSMADRYTYLPFIGLFLIVGVLLDRLMRAWPAWGGQITRIILIVLAFRARNQVFIWDGTVPAFEHAVRVTGGDVLVYDMLGSEYAARGETDLARQAFEHAMAMGPTYAVVPYNYGNLELRAGDYDKAIRLYAQSLKLDVNQPLVLSNMAVALAGAKQYDAALASADAALVLSPQLYEARIARARTLEYMGRAAEAIVDYRAALQLRPASDLARRGMERLNVGP